MAFGFLPIKQTDPLILSVRILIGIEQCADRNVRMITFIGMPPEFGPAVYR